MPRIMECLFRFTRVSRSRLYLTSKRSFLKNEQYFFLGFIVRIFGIIEILKLMKILLLVNLIYYISLLIFS